MLVDRKLSIMVLNLNHNFSKIETILEIGLTIIVLEMLYY